MLQTNASPPRRRTGRLLGRLAASGAAVLALTVAPIPFAAAATATGARSRVRVRLTGQNHTPIVGKKWKYSVSVVDTSGHKLSGRETTTYAYGGSVVGTERPTKVKFRNGVYHDTLIFPATATGVPLTLTVTVTTKYGSATATWRITVKK